MLEAASPEIAVVGATERHLTLSLLQACDDRGVRILPLVSGEVERRHVIALGLLESADASAPWPSIERELSVITVQPGVPVADDSEIAAGSTVLAVWGPAGAPGRTTLAINIAAELATTGRTVALADVDTYSGSVAPALGMLDEAPGFAAACRLAGADSLTNSELERIGTRYEAARSAFWVLTGIGRPSRWPELSAQKVAATIQQCRSWVDFTVIDTGFNLEHDEEISSDLFAPRRNAATLTALREADRVIAVGSADPVGLSRFLRVYTELVETVPASRVIVAINKVRASAIGMNPVAQVSQTLLRFGGIESAATIPFDQAALDAAVLTGRTLADSAPKSPARAAIRDLVLSRVLSARKRARGG